MPKGKPAGTPCVHLDDRLYCGIHGTAGYPGICGSFKPSEEMCGESSEHARRYLSDLEERTR